MDLLLSDFDSLSDSSSSEDQEDVESLYGGQARSIFSSLEETIEKIDDFLMFERGFLHGDIVCLVSDPLGQMGKVINTEMTVDLENIYGSKIQNVCSRYLQKIRSVSLGDYVACGPWIGKVEKIVDCVTILFDDGTECQLSADGPERIIPLSMDMNMIEDPQYPYYPGQRVRVESSFSKSTHWFCGIRKDKHEQGTVCNVDAGLVFVDWLSCVVSGEKKEPLPPYAQDMNNLSLLPCYHYSWQMGDLCVLPVELSFSCASTSRQIQEHNKLEKVVHGRGPSHDSQQVAVIVKTKTKIDVQWQDGSQSLGLESHSLFPVNVVDAHEFWPDAFVLEKGMVEDSQDPGFQRWGFVRSVDPKERTVKVKWCKSFPDLLDHEEEEVVSAYELVEHPEYTYNLGGLVFRNLKSNVDPIDGNHTISKVYSGGEADLKVVENTGDQDLNNQFLSCFGTVIGFKQGSIEVKWSTGAVTKVAPYEIYMADKCEGSIASVLDDGNMQQTPEDLQVKNQLLGQKIKDVLDEKESSLNSISQVAIGVFTSITSSVLGSLGIILFSEYKYTSEEEPHEEEALEFCNLNSGDQLQEEDVVEKPEKITLIHNEANEDILIPSGGKNPKSLRHFDMVNDCSEHHFVDKSELDLQSPQAKRGWLKKVHQEWSILEKDLPETIYVRVYEERIDLLQAAIVGTAGTPYHDGLFFFDIYLPPQYPNEPPMVHYHSGGLRINPNLYETGKVCLSLLNTWKGSQSEVWNPESSSILQVLLSLQALVLNEKPYFNEAGYDSQIGKAEGEKNSLSYNENAFLGTCRSMMYLLRKPPKNFEALVDEHFSRRCRSILSACKAYMQGAPIGHPFNSGKAEEKTDQGSSMGFKLMLAKLYSKLVEAFSNMGIDCNNFLDQVPQKVPM